MDNELYMYDNYTNADIPYVFNRQIVEYDMKSAGLSLVKEFSLAPPETIAKLESYDKEKRVVELGLLQREDKKLLEALKSAFVEARCRFFVENDIQPMEIISIKKDAIFVMRPGGISNGKVGNYIEFREKNRYSSYIRLKSKKLEIYYGKDKTDIKGISDAMIEKHKDYMLVLINSFCHGMEVRDPTSVIRSLTNKITKYKKLQLEDGYYREFNPNSAFRHKNGTTSDMVWDSLSNFDISYNYFNVLLPLAEIAADL